MVINTHARLSSFRRVILLVVIYLIVFAPKTLALDNGSNNHALIGTLYYALKQEEDSGGGPPVYRFDLESGSDSVVGHLPIPLLNHVGLSVSCDGEKIVGCGVKPIKEDNPFEVDVYIMTRNTLGKYDLKEIESYQVPPYPYKCVYDEWDNAIYLTCNEPLPLGEGEGAKFGLQDFKIKATLVIIDLDMGLLTRYDIPNDGGRIGISAISERGVYVGTYTGLRFIARGKVFSLKSAELVSEYFSAESFPLVLSGERGFVVVGHPGRKNHFMLHYVSFAHPPYADLGEAEFAIPKPENGWGVFYQLTNTVSPYSGHCLFAKHFNDFKKTEKSLYWELLALDTKTWETESIVKKFGYNYALRTPPFVFGWVVPERDIEGNKSLSYVYNNNFIYRPWSFGEY